MYGILDQLWRGTQHGSELFTLAAATSIALATFAHVPISTTHAIGGAVSGVGATRGLHSVRWVWGEKIIWAWVLTFPGAGLIGAAGYALAHGGLAPFIH